MAFFLLAKNTRKLVYRQFAPIDILPWLWYCGTSRSLGKTVFRRKHRGIPGCICELLGSCVFDLFCANNPNCTIRSGKQKINRLVKLGLRIDILVVSEYFIIIRGRFLYPVMPTMVRPRLREFGLFCFDEKLYISLACWIYSHSCQVSHHPRLRLFVDSFNNTQYTCIRVISRIVYGLHFRSYIGGRPRGRYSIRTVNGISGCTRPAQTVLFSYPLPWSRQNRF